MSLIRISESDDWIVDYDRERGMYRVSYFEDNHFKDEHWFDEYRVENTESVKEAALSSILNLYPDYSFEEFKADIDKVSNIILNTENSDNDRLYLQTKYSLKSIK